MDEFAIFEQLEKRVEWLDNERRNDKTNLASLQNRITLLETENISLRKQLKEMELAITNVNTQVSSFDKYDNRIDRLNTELTKQIRDVNERAEMNLNESIKRIKLELEATKKIVSDLFPATEQIDAIRNELKSFKLEDSRLARSIEELKQKILEVSRFDEDYRRSLHLLEENRRQETKRLTDIQGEMISIKKRIEETRSRFDNYTDSFRQLETRITELHTYEKDRKETQSIFLDKVNTSLVEKERTFKVWEKRFADIDHVTNSLNLQMEELDKSKATINKAISSVDEIVERFERRINEVSEIQRLNDERFRQEWNTFKADDVKRWSNYVLSQEEQLRSINQQLTNGNTQLDVLIDNSEKNRDDLDLLTREILSHVQSVLAAYQDSIGKIMQLKDRKA